MTGAEAIKRESQGQQEGALWFVRNERFTPRRTLGRGRSNYGKRFRKYTALHDVTDRAVHHGSHVNQISAVPKMGRITSRCRNQTAFPTT
jgi:hypothetical protein